MNNIPTEKMVYEYLKENNIYGDVYIDVDNEVGTRICVEIMWGDWKHDHLRVDYLMKEKFNPMFTFTNVMEENVSDTYSAVHMYVFAKN